jgi:hypothetical protein
MTTSSFGSPNVAQPILASASDRPSGGQTSKVSGLLMPVTVDLVVEGTDNDSDLIALGKQFEEIAAEVRNLCDSPHDNLELLEATLGRLEPIELAIMATPARTVSGLGVKARHAAHVLSEYWVLPIDRVDWDARAVRLLIEAVCNVARVRLPHGREQTS